MARGVEIGRGFIAVDTEDGPARAALKSFSSFATQAFKATAVAAGVLVGAAAKVGLEFNSMKEQAAVAFTTLLGSGEAAQKMLMDLQKFAAQTPFEMEGLVANARNLLGVGVAADKIIPTLTSLGNAAGALGLNQEAFDRIMLATTQSMAKGKIQGEELLQFAENGIPIFDLLGKALGVPKDQIAALGSEGKLVASEVLPKLFDQMQKDYGGAMAAQSKTLAGTWSSLKDNARILAGVGFKPLFDEAKNVVGALGEFAASDKATAFAEKFAAGLDLAIDRTKVFVNQARLGLAGDLGETFSIAEGRAKAYWTTFEDLASNALSGLGTILMKVAPQFNAFFDNLGLAVEPALRAVSSVSESFARNAAGIGSALATAMSVVNGVAAPALSLLGSVLEAAGAVLSTVLDLLGSAPGFFGTLAGVIAASVIGWRLLGGSIADVTKTLTIFSTTGTIASGLQAMASKIDDVALSAGVLTERLTGSSKAGSKVVDVGTRISGSFGALTSILPAVGGALAAVGVILGTYLIQQNALEEGAKRTAVALSEGGQKARDAAGELGRLKGELSGVQAEQDRWNSSMEATVAGADDVYGGQLGDRAMELKDRIAEVDQQFAEHVANLGPVEAAQARYNRAVAEYGPASDQATQASAIWRAAIADEKLKQEQAAEATKTHIDRLLELQATQLGILNADIAYRQALSQQELAQRRATEALVEFGSDSEQYRAAMLQNEQSISNLIDAAGRQAAAQVKSGSDTDKATAAMNGQNAEALRLASIMGSQAPASLQKFVAGLNGTQLAALGVTARVNEAGQAVLIMPDGKEIILTGNNANALAKVKEVNEAKIDNKSFTVFVSVSRDLGDIGNDNDSWGVGGRAIGGPTKPNVPYKVGERGTELIFEDRAQYVATAAQTRSLLNGMGPDAGGEAPSIQQIINTAPGMSEQNVADLAAAGIAWRARMP